MAENHENPGLEPERFLGYRTVRAGQALERRFREALAPSALSPRQFSVLAVLVERPAITVADLARAVLTTPQSMATLVDGLEERGLVTREAPRSRGVAAPLAATPAGRAALAGAAPAVVTMEEEVFAGLPAGGRGALHHALAYLEERLGVSAPTSGGTA